MKKPIPHYSMKDKMVEDIMKDKICDLPTNWGKPAPGGKSAESEKKGEDMYKTNYANPKCYNKREADCSKGKVVKYYDEYRNIHLLCHNCYEHAPYKKKLKKAKKMSIKKVLILSIVYIVIIKLIYVLSRWLSPL